LYSPERDRAEFTPAELEVLVNIYLKYQLHRAATVQRYMPLAWLFDLCRANYNNIPARHFYGVSVLSQELVEIAYKYEHFDVLHYLHRRGFHTNLDHFMTAVKRDNLKMVKHLFENYYMPEYRNVLYAGGVLFYTDYNTKNINDKISYYIKYMEHVKSISSTVSYLAEKGCPVNINLIYDLAARGDTLAVINLLKYIDESPVLLLEIAIKTNNARLTGYLIENNYNYDIPIVLIDYAIKHKITDILNVLKNTGCLKNKSLLIHYLEQQNIDVVKRLHDIGCEWDEDTFLAGLRTDNLAIIRYLHRNGCPYNSHIYAVPLRGECFDYVKNEIKPP